MIAVIPARRGSKSIPGKNHKPIAGRPLVEWVIRAALEASRVERVLVSTDDPVVASIAAELRAEVHNRSEASATDTATTESALLEALDNVDGGFALLQATSPLTTAEDIDGAIGLYESGEFDSVVSVAPQTRFIWTEGADSAEPWNYDPQARPRRQDSSPYLVENGAIYISDVASLKRANSRISGRVGLFKMRPETYHELDEPGDRFLIEKLLLERTAPDLSKVKLVLSDVDGVLTDNGMYISNDGAEMKRFSARDGKGFEMLHLAGVKTGLLTSESADLVAARGRKLGCEHVALGCKDKVAEAEVLRVRLGLDWSQVAFIGDDIHDAELLRTVGASFSPADALPEIQRVVGRVLTVNGGSGCFREMANLIAAAQN